MRYVIQLAALIVSFVVGVFVYALLADWLPLQVIASHIYEGWQWGIAHIGVTLWGLAGLTAYFIVLTARLVIHSLRHTTPIASDGLRYISDAGPNIGVLGTMLALSQAMVQMDMGGGLQTAVRGLTVSMGQALNSSIGGIMLALAAHLLRHFTAAEEA